MTRVAATAWIVAATCSFDVSARSQPVISPDDTSVDDVAPDEVQPNLVPPPVRAAPPCGCCCAVPALDPFEAEMKTAMIVGGSVAAIGQLLAIWVAASQPHGLSTVDAVPIFGAISAAQRGGERDNQGPLLLFAAGVQAIGALVIGVAASELAHRRRLLIDVSAGPSGAGASLTWRY